MSWLLSTGASEALLGKQAAAVYGLYSATAAFEDGTGTGGNDRVADAVVDLSGFDDYAYYILSIIGSTSNDGDYIIQNAAAGYIELPAGSLTTEALGDDIMLVVSIGGSFADVFRNSVLDLYDGSRPATADLAEAGDKLVQITNAGAAFVSESPDNGINFGSVSGNDLDLATDPGTGSAQALEGDGIKAGSALSGWLYANTVVTGASSVAVRAVGRCAVSNAEINMSAGTDVAVGVPATVTSVSLVTE